MIPKSIRSTAVALIVLASLGGCSDASLGNGPESLDRSVRVQIVAGNAQKGVAGKELLKPLAVLATRNGKPLPGITVNFLVMSGGGSVYGGAETTDKHGVAQEYWTLGTDAREEQKIEVRAVDGTTGERLLLATFTADAVADAPYSISTGCSGWLGCFGAPSMPVHEMPFAAVYDHYGNAVPDVPVRFRPVSSIPGATYSVHGDAVVGSTPVATNAEGIAYAPSLTLGAAVGLYGIGATVEGANGQLLTAASTVEAYETNDRLLVVESGDGQTVRAGEPILLIVRVVEKSTGAMLNTQTQGQYLPALFSVEAGGGLLSELGVDQVGGSFMWLSGVTVGVNVVRASVAGIGSVTITVQGT